MPEKRRRNRFEEHINSDAFDLSKLENLVPPFSEEEHRVLNYLAQLPQPLDESLWETELDEEQRLLCAYLTTELADNVMRSQHSELVEHLGDEELLQVLTLPVVLGMLVEANLHQAASEPQEPVVAVDERSMQTGHFAEIIGSWWQDLRNRVSALLRRIRGQI